MIKTEKQIRVKLKEKLDYKRDMAPEGEENLTWIAALQWVLNEGDDNGRN
jgi:hypothetical protein